MEEQIAQLLKENLLLKETNNKLMGENNELKSEKTQLEEYIGSDEKLSELKRRQFLLDARQKNFYVAMEYYQNMMSPNPDLELTNKYINEMVQNCTDLQDDLNDQVSSLAMAKSQINDCEDDLEKYQKLFNMLSEELKIKNKQFTDLINSLIYIIAKKDQEINKLKQMNKFTNFENLRGTGGTKKIILKKMTEENKDDIKVKDELEESDETDEMQE